jgi:hypothetical protein
MVKTSIRELLSVPVIGREGFNGNRISRTLSPRWNTAGWRLGRRPWFGSVGSFEPVLNGCRQAKARLHVIGAAMLLAIRMEFGKSVDWLLTGKAFVEPKKRVTKDPAER